MFFFFLSFKQFYQGHAIHGNRTLQTSRRICGTPSRERKRYNIVFDVRSTNEEKSCYHFAIYQQQRFSIPVINCFREPGEKKTFTRVILFALFLDSERSEKRNSFTRMFLFLFFSCIEKTIRCLNLKIFFAQN